MVCTSINPCIQGEKSDVTLSIPRVTPSGSVKEGQTVTISVDVTDISWLLGETVVIDVVDIDSGICVYTENFWLNKGVTRVTSFQIIMPSRNLNLRISASSFVVGIFPLPSGWRCEDVRAFSISLQYTKYNCVSNQCVGPLLTGTYNSREECIAAGCAPPIATRYNCVSGVCRGPLQEGTYGSLTECTTSGCKVPGDGGGEECGSGKIGLFGQCYKTSDVAIVGGAAVLLFVMMRQ